MTRLATAPEETAELPLRKSIRRLRWFVTAFEDQIESIAAETGNRFEIDHTTLSTVFVDWLRAFEAQKPSVPEHRPAYVGFAAGLMLRTLIQHKPLKVLEKPDNADTSNPAYFWPEGYCYVAFCLNVRALVLEQDFHEKQKTVPELSEMRTWWSFKENISENPSLAIAFLDVFAGAEPDWQMPSVFRTDGDRALAARFYEEIEKS